MELHPASLSPDNLQKGQTCWNHCAKPCSCLLGLGLAETTSRAPRHQRVSGGALHSRGRRKQGTLGLRVKSRSVGAARASLGPTPPAQPSPGKATKSIDAGVNDYSKQLRTRPGLLLLGLM